MPFRSLNLLNLFCPRDVILVLAHARLRFGLAQKTFFFKVPMFQGPVVLGILTHAGYELILAAAVHLVLACENSLASSKLLPQ